VLQNLRRQSVQVDGSLGVDLDHRPDEPEGDVRVAWVSDSALLSDTISPVVSRHKRGV
jgi:hypothetical protein